MSRRALVSGLETPRPLGLALPAIYHEDEFAQRWLSAFDAVLAPIICTLDNLDCYFDPEVAPDDFVAWLGTWVGVAVDENWAVERQRVLVEQAAELYRWRGTSKGLADHVAIYTGVTPEIADSGGCGWSASPGAPPPGDATCTVVVRVRAGEQVDPERLDRLVAAAKPAHVAHRIEIV